MTFGVATFADYDVVLVGLHCPVEELERRELERGNRPVGLAAFQIPIVHENMRYDVEVNTSGREPRDCAQEIKTFLDQGVRPRALPGLASVSAAASL